MTDKLTDNVEQARIRIEREAIAYTGGYNEKTHADYMAYVKVAELFEAKRSELRNKVIEECIERIPVFSDGDIKIETVINILNSLKKI